MRTNLVIHAAKEVSDVKLSPVCFSPMLLRGYENAHKVLLNAGSILL